MGFYWVYQVSGVLSVLMVLFALNWMNPNPPCGGPSSSWNAVPRQRASAPGLYNLIGCQVEVCCCTVLNLIITGMDAVIL